MILLQGVVPIVRPGDRSNERLGWQRALYFQHYHSALSRLQSLPRGLWIVDQPPRQPVEGQDNYLKTQTTV